METLLIKKDKAVKMFENLTKNINDSYNTDKKTFDKQIKLPSFLW
jgi:hypothetical protein